MIEETILAVEVIIQNFHLVLIGVIVGMAFGVIPGMGGVVTLTLLLPFTMVMDQHAAFILLSAGWGATTFSGSITAILLNTPGTSSNAATLLDGYPLTKEGDGAKAIGASAFSSASGATVGLGIFFLLIPVVIEMALLFGPSEVFWLIVIGLSILPLVSGDKILAGLAAGGLGLVLSFVGHNPVSGEFRFTFGQSFLFDGVGLIPALLGLFAISEMIKLSSEGRGTQVASDSFSKVKKSDKWDGMMEVVRHKWLWFRCSLIGTIVGAIPGAGGSAATFIAYSHAVQTSSDPQEFGHGRIEGVVAAEAANDAKDGGQLFPTLGLGIPGSASAAVLIGGFMMHGIFPSPRMMSEHLDLMLIIVLALFCSNVVSSIIGVVFTDVFVKITTVPLSKLFPVIIVFSFVAVFLLRTQIQDIVIAVMFAILGLAFIYSKISRVPIVLGLVLGEMAEINFHNAVMLSDGGVVGGLFTGTLNIVLIITLIIFIGVPIINRLTRIDIPSM